MKSLFDDDYSRYSDRDVEKPRTEKENKCKKCVCELLAEISNKQPDGPLDRTYYEQKLLILSNGTNQPLSVDGMDPTIFTLESFNPKTCCATFRFNSELIDSTSGTTPICGKLIKDCHSIAGIFQLDDHII